MMIDIGPKFYTVLPSPLAACDLEIKVMDLITIYELKFYVKVFLISLSLKCLSGFTW